MADGFLGRWSRRKQEALAGKPLPEEPPAPVIVPAVAPVPAAPLTARPPVVAGAAGAHEPGRSAVGVVPEPVIEPAPPTLAQAQTLTPQSDFKPFVARGVAPEVRNAAMKKLFADPHFNVMDGLDIYIDDYSRPDPLPLAMLRQMASAQFLGMVQEEPAPQQAAGSVPAGADKDPVAACAAPAHSVPPPADVAQSQPLTTSGAPVPAGFLPEGGPLASAAPHDHAHADLRLQPDHAPPAPGAGGAAP
ncbi:DUF3306 domain-containing protein [Simplicispira metamorpha]|uniref:Uncharacterized protein DUF3306 n=1 Tax=Simplicispira metamorpha TaxID=80881 RepID=A0A4V2SKK5_9BURK|nr:DUF3306 domain-containing protein [Simplicispira metamorpha]TCP19876.1 uncharacterized protein DUF3306 [Simplicispira metamorpha]